MKLNNIVKVGVCPCSQLTGLVKLSLTTAKLKDTVYFTYLENVKYPCQLTISEKTNDKCKEFTSKLNLDTCDDWFDDGRNAYLCITADGDKYLIGNASRPYPTVTIEQKHPDKGSDSQLTEVSIQWISPKIPPIIVE